MHEWRRLNFLMANLHNLPDSADTAHKIPRNSGFHKVNSINSNLCDTGGIP